MTTDASPINEKERWRLGPLYTIPEVARLSSVHHSTVRRWLYGSQTPRVRMRPVFNEQARRDGKAVVVSFLELAEIVVVSKFRSKRVTLERIRRAHSYARKISGLEYPFAHLSLASDGVRILTDFHEVEPGERFLALDPNSGQLTLPGHVAEAIGTFEFEGDLVARWYPAGRHVPIVIDPRFSSGVPTVPNRRLTIHAIRSRWKAGYKIQFISEDLALDADEVEEVLRYADQIAA